MTLAKGPDPVKPMITFDNYIIPETVREVRNPKLRALSASPVGSYFSSEPKPKRQSKAKPKQGQAARMLPIGLVIFGTFMLGVLTTLYFANSPQPEMALIEPSHASTPIPVEYETSIEAPQVAESAVAQAPQLEPVVEPSTGTMNLERAVFASLQYNNNLQPDVTRQDSADLIAPAGAEAEPNLSAVSLAAILTGLTPNRSPDVDSAAQNDRPFLTQDTLAVLRKNVLSGTYTVKTVQRNGVKRLCLRVPNANVSQDQAADLLREAAERGEIELPEAVSTADGNFDADTLIFNLVQTSLANDGTEAGAEAAREMSRRAFIASNAKTSIVLGERFYMVQPGDSLAYLSLQFYGKPSDYIKIYQANRGILRSPDLIQVGQRLIIPG